MMALMATAGVCTSCSNDNEPQPEESAQNPSIEQVKQVWNEVGQEMKSVDPAPLNQLLTALNDKGTKMTTRAVDEETGAEGEETEVSPDMIDNLKEILALTKNEMDNFLINVLKNWYSNKISKNNSLSVV